MSETNPNARLEMFCDGVFAIALTLLIIDVKVPSSTPINSTAALWLALKNILPSIFAFILSFAIILITWVNHHNAFKLAGKTSSAFMYANGLLLLSVVFIPFPTSLIGEYILTDHAAPTVVIYNLVLMLQAFSWSLICTAGLKGNLAKGEKSIQQTRRNRTYAYFSVLLYAVLAILSVWFPLPVLITTMLLWILWLLLGINIRPDEEL